MGSSPQGVLVESVLTQALALRRAEVSLLICDGALLACQMTKSEGAPPERLVGGIISVARWMDTYPASDGGGSPNNNTLAVGGP